MSPRAACRLEHLGFALAYNYVGGIADWKAAGLPAVRFDDADLAQDLYRRSAWASRDGHNKSISIGKPKRPANRLCNRSSRGEVERKEKQFEQLFGP